MQCHHTHMPCSFSLTGARPLSSYTDLRSQTQQICIIFSPVSLHACYNSTSSHTPYHTAYALFTTCQLSFTLAQNAQLLSLLCTHSLPPIDTYSHSLMQPFHFLQCPFHTKRSHPASLQHQGDHFFAFSRTHKRVISHASISTSSLSHTHTLFISHQPNTGVMSLLDLYISLSSRILSHSYTILSLSHRSHPPARTRARRQHQKQHSPPPWQVAGWQGTLWSSGTPPAPLRSFVNQRIAKEAGIV